MTASAASCHFKSLSLAQTFGRKSSLMRCNFLSSTDMINVSGSSKAKIERPPFLVHCCKLASKRGVNWDSHWYRQTHVHSWHRWGQVYCFGTDWEVELLVWREHRIVPLFSTWIPRTSLVPINQVSVIWAVSHSLTSPSQSVHPAAVWQKIERYPLPYHQTTEQLHSSGRRTH